MNRIIARLQKIAEEEKTLFDFYNKKDIANAIKDVIEDSLRYPEIIEYCEKYNVNPSKIKNNPMKFYDIINIFIDNDDLIEDVFNNLHMDLKDANLQYDDDAKSLIKNVAKNLDNDVDTKFSNSVYSEIDEAINFMK